MIRNQISKVFEYKQCRVVRPSKACLLWNMSHPCLFYDFWATNPKSHEQFLLTMRAMLEFPISRQHVYVSHLHDFQSKQLSFFPQHLHCPQLDSRFLFLLFCCLSCPGKASHFPTLFMESYGSSWRL